VPRDASDTRTRLLREAERIFATRGVFQATVREITEAAGQRNVSALSYHFGSRQAVLGAILKRHGDPLDAERAQLVIEPIEDMGTRQLVAALLVPLAARLATPEGRDYLRIVAQLADQFPAWRESTLDSPHLNRILAVLEARAGGAEPGVRRARVVNIIMLMTAAMAERARTKRERGPTELGEAEFLANLADVIVGGLEAAPGPPLAASALLSANVSA
jgi:AcrR family transcriptional regulator